LNKENVTVKVANRMADHHSFIKQTIIHNTTTNQTVTTTTTLSTKTINESYGIAKTTAHITSLNKENVRVKIEKKLTDHHSFTKLKERISFSNKSIL